MYKRVTTRLFLAMQVWMDDRTNVVLGDEAAREHFAGSVVSETEAQGLWENDPRYHLQTRTTDFWRGRGVAYKVSDSGIVQTDQNWKYQVVVCDESSKVPFGFFVSGMNADSKGCFKTCDNWCGDHITDHYRASWGDMFCDDMHGAKPEWCVGRGTPESTLAEGQGGSRPCPFEVSKIPHLLISPSDSFSLHEAAR